MIKYLKTFSVCAFFILSMPLSAQHKHVQLGSSYAFDASGKLWMVGLNETQKLTIQSSNDFGKTWVSKQLEADLKISADGENRPKIAIRSDGVMVITYTRPLSKPYTGEIRMIRSVDGINFSEPITVHDDRQQITHRFESTVFDAKGGLHIIWVDKRDAELARSMTGRKDAYSGAGIYRKYSNDGGKSFGPDIKLADHSCECCRIALIPTLNGKALAMWRHVFDGSIRDHATAIIDGEQQEKIRRASYDGWRLNACPHHGPALAVAPNGNYHAVWFGEKKNIAGVRYGLLNAAGEAINTVRELPDPKAEHADIASHRSNVVIAWRSYNGGETEVKVWVSMDGGKNFQTRLINKTSLDNDYPQLIKKSEDIYLVWRTTKEIYVEHIR
jgi:hypothetical protein